MRNWCLILWSGSRRWFNDRPVQNGRAIVQRNISRMTSLLNSDATKRWFWSHCRPRACSRSETITELQVAQKSWFDLSKYAHSSALDMYMTQLDLVWYKHNHWTIGATATFNDERWWSNFRTTGRYGWGNSTSRRGRLPWYDFIFGATAQEDIFDDMMMKKQTTLKFALRFVNCTTIWAIWDHAKKSGSKTPAKPWGRGWTPMHG